MFTSDAEEILAHCLNSLAGGINAHKDRFAYSSSKLTGQTDSIHVPVAPVNYGRFRRN